MIVHGVSDVGMRREKNVKEGMNLFVLL